MSIAKRYLIGLLLFLIISFGPGFTATDEQERYPEGSLVYSFDDVFYEDALMAGASAVKAIEVRTESGKSFARIYPDISKTDPFFYLPINLDYGKVSTQEYRCMIMKVRTRYPERAVMYFATTDDVALSESQTQSPVSGYKGTGDWEYIVFDYSGHERYTGDLLTARFDLYSRWPEGIEYFDIAWFAMARSRADIQAIGIKIDEYIDSRIPTPRPTKTPGRTKGPEMSSTIETNLKSSFDIKDALVISGLIIVCVIACAVSIAVLGRKRSK